VKVALYR